MVGSCATKAGNIPRPCTKPAGIENVNDLFSCQLSHLREPSPRVGCSVFFLIHFTGYGVAE